MWIAVPRVSSILVALIVAACGSSHETDSEGQAYPSPEPARWVDFLDDAEALGKVAVVSVERSPVRVMGRRFQTRCVGEGAPNVMLVSGQGTPLENWDEIQARIGSIARVCAYDRLGIGTSGKPPPSQTFTSFAEDLDGVMDALALQRPLIVVGHSLGGPIAMTWATSHARDTAGVVLVDSASAQFVDWYTAGMSAAEKAAPQDPADNPEHVDDRVAWAQLKDLPRLGDVPLVVLTHDPSNPDSVEYHIPERDPKDAAEAWVEGQRQWALHSDEAELVTVQGAGHFIHHHVPSAVTAAILQAKAMSAG